MKKICILFVLAMTIGFDFCCAQQVKEETVLDGIIHIEEIIHENVPNLPRLCDTVELSKKKVDIGDCELYVELEGEGIPIVLINGGPGGTHHYFHPWFSALKKKHQLIYYDQRGSGLSDFNPDSGYTFRQAAEDLEKLRLKLGISKWIVYGYSYGGALAQLYALLYPEPILGMILNSAHPVFESEAFQSQQQKYISPQERRQIKLITQKAVEDKRKGKLNFKAFLYNTALNGDWKRQSFYKPTANEMIRSALYEWVNDKKFNSTVSNSMKDYDFEGLFKNCPIPTLLFEGKYDLTWGDKKAAIFKQNHPHASYVHFEKSGHGVFKDEPKKFIEEVLKFTKNLNGTSKESLTLWKKEVEPSFFPNR